MQKKKKVKRYGFFGKRYGFSSFAKNKGKNLCNKYGQDLLDSAKKSTTDKIKTASKRVIQKTAEDNANDDANSEIEVPKKKDTYLQKKGNKLLMN